MAKRLAKKWFVGAPPVGKCRAAPTRRILARLNGARNYEQWARLQMYEKDQEIEKLDSLLKEARY